MFVNDKIKNDKIKESLTSWDKQGIETMIYLGKNSLMIYEDCLTDFVDMMCLSYKYEFEDEETKQRMIKYLNFFIQCAKQIQRAE